VNRKSLILAALLPAAALLAACGSNSAGSSSGGTTTELAVGVMSQFQNPNPFNAFSIMDYDVEDLEYPYLVQYNADDQIAPDLAKSWSTSDGGKVWTFHLVPNAKWSDGKPLTSADVAFTWDTILKYVKGPTALDAENVTDLLSVKATNPTTVVFTYSAPLASVLTYINNTSILPEHIWAKYATGNGAQLKTFGNKPPIVSGGPYIPEQWNGTTTLILKRNPNWYGPKPAASEVVIEYYTTPDGLIQALKSGQIDYANAIPQSSASVVRGDGLIVDEYPSVQYLDLFFNMDHPNSSAILDSTLRHALNYAVDRSQIISVAYPGSQPGESIVTPAAEDWNPAVKPPAFDLAKANQMLNQAGYKMGSGGVRVAPDGKKLAFTVIFDNGLGGAGQRAFQILQSDFAKVGVQLNLKTLDTTAFLAAMFGSNNTYTGWDMAMETDAGLLDPGYDLAYFTCADFGSYNFSGYCNAHYDQLYLEQAAATDPTVRRQIADQLQVFADQQLPALTLLYTSTVDVHQHGWTGFGENPYGALNPMSQVTFETIHKG
jgi:peptide/nickel transport system substrate-binding protein